MVNKIRIDNKKDFIKNYGIILDALEYINTVDAEHIPDNIRDCYAYEKPLPSSSLLYALINNRRYYDNGYFELAFEGDDLIGFGGVYIDKNVSHLAKRTYIVKNKRPYYQNQTLFLPDQLAFRKDECLFAVQTFNEGQKKIYRAIKRIVDGKPIFLNKSLSDTFPVYLSNNMVFLDGTFRVNSVDQYVVVFNYNNLDEDVIINKMLEFAE